MLPYKIGFKPSVEKDLRKLPKIVSDRVIQKIENLRTEPFPSHTVKLSGAERLFRIRIGAYRIIYEVDSQTRRITIHYIRHRSQVYEDL